MSSPGTAIATPFGIVVSMLHESPGANSATRMLHGRPVLSHTLARVDELALDLVPTILCTPAQADAVRRAVGDHQCDIEVIDTDLGPDFRASVAASKFLDGWRGGLLAGCWFDRGFHAPTLLEIAGRRDIDAMLLIDPAAALLDLHTTREIIARADNEPDYQLVFTPAAPGVGGVVVRKTILEKLRDTRLTPGTSLTYQPAKPSPDPISLPASVVAPKELTRTRQRLLVDSSRAVRRLESIIGSVELLNGTIDRIEIMQRLETAADVDSLPRDITIELTTKRDSSPVFLPMKLAGIERGDLSIDAFAAIVNQLEDDVRLHLAGVGDPLKHPQFTAILDLARRSGVSIHVETDLLTDNADAIDALVQSEVDVVSIHLPGMRPETYAAVMGVNGMPRVMENLNRLLVKRGKGVPILVPTFVKCRTNLGEMEAWYDQWLRTLGSAVIRGPSCFSGRIDDVGVADMSPPLRKPCMRLETRLSILSDGRIVSCDQDVLGEQSLGEVESSSLRQAWKRLGQLRADHRAGRWSLHQVCEKCREWHRP